MYKRSMYQQGFNRPYFKADAVNLEGKKAFSKPMAESFAQILNTGGLFNTYYVTQKELLKNGRDIIANYIKEDPVNAAKIIVDARNNGFMRSMPIVALSYLSYHHEPFKQIFLKVVRTPRDLVEFIDVTRSHRGLGRSIKEQIRNYINKKLTQFYAMKYKSQFIIAAKLSRPSGNNPLLDYVFGKEIDLREFEQLWALEMLKKGEIEPIVAIKDFRLDMQTVIGIKSPTPAEWEALVPGMSAFQLIKNIATLERHIGADKTVLMIQNYLTVDRLKKGKVLPFRVFQAYEKVQNPFIKTYLADLVNAYTKYWDWSTLGKVCIAPDVSASMGWTIRNVKWIPKNISGMFSGILKAGIGKNAFLLPWDSKIYGGYIGGKDVMSICNAIKHCGGGGTTMKLPVDYLLQKKIKVDTFILLTDGEEWGQGWLTSWIKYKKFNPKAKAYLIRVDPYNSNPFSADQATKYDIHQIYGYNDNVLKILFQ